MPIPISQMFLGEDKDIHSHPRQKDVREMSKGWPSIDVKLSEIPHLDYPPEHTRSMKEDINLVKSCYFNPMCDIDFLNLSNDKPFQLFKKYVADNNLDMILTLSIKLMKI